MSSVRSVSCFSGVSLSIVFPSVRAVYLRSAYLLTVVSCSPFRRHQPPSDILCSPLVGLLVVDCPSATRE